MRPDAGQRVADLVGDAGEQLAQRRQPLAPPQLGLEPLALGRLSSDRPRQADGQDEREGDPGQRQAREPSVTPGRLVDEDRIDEPGHGPGGGDDPTVHTNRGRPDGDRVRGDVLDHRELVPLPVGRVNLGVDVVVEVPPRG